MNKILAALLTALLLLVVSTDTLLAQSYTVPLVIDQETYTLTVVIDGESVAVMSDADDLTVGAVTRLLEMQEEEDEQDLTQRKATAKTIAYDDLFRNNEEHVGEVIRYVGQVLEYRQAPCLLNCAAAGHILRVAVTEGSFGLWDDAIWVDYAGDDRFLEEDIVTVWGTVIGLESYSALLGNTVTIPKVEALDIVLGREENPPSDKATTQTASARTDAGTTAAPSANRGANLRGGPGTNYPVVGAVKLNDPLTVVARTADGTWLQLASEKWIAAFLVDDVPATLPVADEIPAPPAATEAPATAPAGTPATAPAAQSNSSSIVGIGEELQGNGWRFKLIETHKRKSVYFYDDGDAAMGHWLIVILDAVNEQSGTDYFKRNIDPYLTDDAGNVYRMDGGASSYAEWQYGGLSSPYVDVDPGKLARVAMAFDIPDGVGRLLLSTDLPAWINIGDFSAMEIEE